MTIKEVEMLSGLTRANIRFYEAEGLLTPERRANGYRTYSEADLAMLKKIRLLRSLRFSLEDVKRLQAGEASMDSALNAHLETLRTEQLHLQLSRQICETMRSDGVTFGTMDAQRYLDALAQKSRLDSPVPDTDAVPRVNHLWRRYFARSLDFLFYGAAWDIFLALVWNVNLAGRPGILQVFDAVMALALMLLLEPLLLSWFGTTLGKWILGLYVTDNDGERLSRGEAFSRTWRVLVYGMGLQVPLVRLYRKWRSYRACVSGEMLQWENESELSLKDKRPWRVAAWLGAHVMIFAVLFLSVAVSLLPKNRGDITVAQFSENYNQQSRYYGCEDPYYLDAHGRWVERNDPGVVYADIFAVQQPQFIYSETDGVMTGLSFTVTEQGENRNASLYRQKMFLCLHSFLGAQKGVSIFSKEVRQIVKTIETMDGKGFAYHVGDFEVACEVSYSGYDLVDALDVLFPQEGANPRYTFLFSIQKQET